MLVERIGSSGLDPELFCIELTENATVANLARAEALIRRLRRLGCGVALDDFGTGLSSLACLRQLPVSMLKIDGSFVRDVLKDPRAESMVRAIAQLAHSMSITTVAEYIETEAIGTRIAELGVDYGQGFAIGKPIPLSELLIELPLPSAPAELARAAADAAAPEESVRLRGGGALMRAHREPARVSVIRLKRFVSWRAGSLGAWKRDRGALSMSMRSRTLVALIAGVILGFCGALTSGVLADRSSDAARADAARPAPRAGLPWQEASLFAEVYERIKRDYVDEVDDHALMEKAVRGMVAALDPHSAYLDSEEFDEIRLSTMGSYPGVGIEVVAEDGVVKVLRPIEGSPAQQAGLLPGDEIVRIDDADIGADLAGAIARMRGASGSLVTLTVRREGTPGVLQFALRRAQVEVHSVAQQSLEPGYGYLRITSFSETTAQDVNRAILRLKRDNPGGA